MTTFSPDSIPIVRNHIRLLGGLLLGVLVELCLPVRLSLMTRLIVAWDSAALIYLGLSIGEIVTVNSSDVLRRLAAKEDQSRWMILVLMTVASFVSLIAIGTLLSTVKGLPPLASHLHLALGGLTVLASWSMMHMVFAIHYAHFYYGDANDSPTQYEARGGLMFPGNKEPVLSDFVYYSFVVGMTCQVSDVQVSSHVMRRLTLAHGVLAFFFNTVVLALSVNIAAGLLS